MHLTIHLKRAFIALATLFSAATVIAQTTFYVDSNLGSDANSGTSPQTAWQTLGRADNQAYVPGDSLLLVRGGRFTAPSTSNTLVGDFINCHGTQSAPITIGDYPNSQPGLENAPRPIISNPHLPTYAWNGGLRFLGCSHIVVKNITFRDIGGNAITVQRWASGNGAPVPSHHVTIRDCEIDSAATGVAITESDNVKVLNCNIHDLQMSRNTTSLPIDDDSGAIGILVMGSSHNEIAYSTFHKCRAESEDHPENGGAVEIFALAAFPASFNEIHHNLITECEGCIEVGGQAGSTADANVFAFNVAVDNRLFAWLHNAGTFGAAIPMFRVLNNTFVEYNSPRTTFGGVFPPFIGTTQAAAVPFIQFINNIVQIGTPAVASVQSGIWTTTAKTASLITYEKLASHIVNLDRSFNLYSINRTNTSPDFFSNAALGGGEVAVDPIFMKQNGSGIAVNLDLQSTSPARGIGAVLSGMPIWFNSCFASRPAVGSARNIGAFN